MNTKQAMQQAKKHIQAKEYDKARAILAKIDHPTARRWEQKLPKSKASTTKSPAIFISLAASIALIVGLSIGFLTGRLTASQLEIALQTGSKTTSVSNSVELTTTALVQSNATVFQEATEYSKKWFTSESTSAIDDSVSRAISTYAQDPVQNWLSESTPILFVRCDGSEWDVFINAGSQVEANLDGDVFVRTRYDNAEAESQVAGESVTGEAFFFRYPEQEIRRMLDANRLVVAYTPFNTTSVEAIFDLTGLEEAIQPLEQNCGSL